MKDTANIESAAGARAEMPNRKRRIEPWREGPVWETIPGSDWRQLYGGFHDLGVSLEWQEFQSPRPFEWSRSFHPDSLELCLNLEGEGTVQCEGEKMAFGPLTAGFYLTGGKPLRASRAAQQPQRFVSVEFSRSFLRDRLAACDGALHPMVEAFARGDRPSSSLGGIQHLTAGQEQRLADLRNPTTLQGARPLWYEAKVLEWMAEFFFERQGEDELFCDRQKRLARERADRVIAILQKRLDESLSLKEIGREVGCSPFHLSRTFSVETGMTISQYLRRLRMERAAELLRSGKYNVTEAAMAVGYSSLSYFSQAFCQTMGCCPGLYPLKAAEQGTAASPI